ncbi:MAG: VOC family protein [Bryobacteraceae bacterium]
MHRAVALLLLAILASAAELSIDHVTVAGKELKTMMANLGAVGLKCEYGGPHSNHATEMALTSFPDGSYLELIALQPNAVPHAVAAHIWTKQMENNAGPCAWAVRVKDIGAEVDRLKGLGIPVSAPLRNGRKRPDGERLEWETAQIGNEPNGTFFPFVIRDLTPRRERAFPSGHPTAKDFSGVTKVVIAVRDLETCIDRYRRAYGLAPPIKQVDSTFGAHLASFGGTPVVLAAPLTAQSWLVTRLDQFGEGPCAFILQARKASHFQVSSKTRWFGVDISWFDSGKLGWHLGFE